MTIRFGTTGSFNLIPDKAGVYIVGVEQDLGNERFFCPLYVGEADNLKRRITEHYSLSGGYVNHRKELFDFVTYPINKVYEDIKSWNLFHWNFKKLKLENWLTPVNNKGVSEEIQKYILYASISNKTMIYFNCKTFFDYYLNSSGVSNYAADRDWHSGAILDLNRIGSNAALNLAKKIKNVKAEIRNNFYYAYWAQSDHGGKCERQEIEAQTKYALECLNIFTYGAVNGCGKTVYKKLHSIPSSKYSNIIDLSVLSDIYNPNNKELFITI